MRKQYLSTEVEGSMIKVTTHDGVQITNTVCLEPELVNTLRKFVQPEVDWSLLHYLKAIAKARKQNDIQ